MIRIVKTNGVITFTSLVPGSYPNTYATLDATSTGAQGQFYNYLKNLDGKHIGFTTSTSGSGVTNDVASFDYLRTSLNVLTPATVTGRVALEGVSNLAGISQYAPLGVFDVQFRAPGSATPLYEFKNVSLTTTAGSAFGSYSIPGIPNGTYDVWIKGAKNLAVLVPNVLVGATASVPDVTLPAADANGDNFADTSDFGVLVGVYGSDSNVTGSGYDASADFNFDGFVDTTDFGLLVGEYGAQGAQ